MTHEKKRLPQGVELENRYIGFHRQPVQQPQIKPVINGLPNSLREVFKGYR